MWKWTWTEGREWCLGLSISKDFTDKGFRITLVVLFVKIEMEFEKTK